MEDFCNKMQLMNAVGYQGIFEAAGHKLNEIGGVMLWKLNAAFPSVVWQVYDWYLMPNAGYYFMQNAIEPLHIQLNLSSMMVMAVNRKYRSVSGLKADASIYGIDSRVLFHEEKDVDISGPGTQEALSLAKPLSGDGVKFVVLNLRDSQGMVVSHNVYWLSGNKDYKAMNNMERTSVFAKLLDSKKGNSEHSWTIRISNNSDRIAFFLRPQLMVGDEEVLPSYWSSNYFTLAPSETTTVTVSCPSVKIRSEKPVIEISGWNVDKQELPVK